MEGSIRPMSYADVNQRLDAGGVIVLDGATGTELQRRGVPMDAAAWCGPATLAHDDVLTEIHADYIRAGADVVTANTFAASRLMLEPAGLGDRVGEVATRAVEAALRARELTRPDVAVAGSLSHMVPVADGTAAVDPRRVPSAAAVGDALYELANLLATAGVDHIMLEMMYNPVRTPLAVEAALSTGLPVWFGASARRGDGGELLSFDQLEPVPLADIIAMIPDDGIDAVGVMHTSAELIADVLAELRPAFAGPLLAYPDSGYFEMPDWRFVDTIEPARLQRFFTEWIDAGTQIIGGCCGLSVPHVEAAARARDEHEAARR